MVDFVKIMVVLGKGGVDSVEVDSVKGVVDLEEEDRILGSAKKRCQVRKRLTTR